MIEHEQVMPLILEACPSFKEAWDGSDSQERLYVVVGDLANHLLELYRDQRIDEFGPLCEVIERLNTEGSSFVKELVAIGFLEGVQNVWTDPEEFCRFLLPESRKLWKEQNDFWTRRPPDVDVGLRRIAKKWLKILWMASGMLLALSLALWPMAEYGMYGFPHNMTGELLITLSWVWFGLMSMSPVLTLILWQKLDVMSRIFVLLYPGFLFLVAFVIVGILSLFFEFGEYAQSGTESSGWEIVPLILFLVTVSGITVLRLIRSNKEPYVSFRISKRIICCIITVATLLGVFAVWRDANTEADADVGPEKTLLHPNCTFVVSDYGEIAFKPSTNHVIEHVYGWWSEDKYHVADRILIEFQDPTDKGSESCKIVQATRTGPRDDGDYGIESLDHLWVQIRQCGAHYHVDGAVRLSKRRDGKFVREDWKVVNISRAVAEFNRVGEE